ncbi:MAG: chlorite dismutase family protein [Verrucomicrobiota bacterium]
MTTEAVHPPETSTGPLRPQEGLGALHLFYRVNLAAWRAKSAEDRAAAREHLELVVGMARRQPQTQVITLAMFAPADLGFMILARDLQELNGLEKQITAALGPDVLVPEFTYLSLTERSEYTQKDDEYALELEKTEGIAVGSAPSPKRS